MIKRKLNLEPSGIIEGDKAHSILEVFPQLGDKFRQRKTYYEYYCDIHDTEIEIGLEQIEQLNENYITVEFFNDEFITFKL